MYVNSCVVIVIEQLIDLKVEKDDKIKQLITSKIEEYLARAEALKTHISIVSAHASARRTVSAKTILTSNHITDENRSFKERISRFIRAEKPKVGWSEVIGLDAAKSTLKAAAIMPITHPQLYQDGDIPFRGILVYGPPGSGKTYIGNAIATQISTKFFGPISSDFPTTWGDDSVK